MLQTDASDSVAESASAKLPISPSTRSRQLVSYIHEQVGCHAAYSFFTPGRAYGPRSIQALRLLTSRYLSEPFCLTDEAHSTSRYGLQERGRRITLRCCFALRGIAAAIFRLAVVRCRTQTSVSW